MSVNLIFIYIIAYIAIVVLYFNINVYYLRFYFDVNNSHYNKELKNTNSYYFAKHFILKDDNVRLDDSIFLIGLLSCMWIVIIPLLLFKALFMFLGKILNIYHGESLYEKMVKLKEEEIKIEYEAKILQDADEYGSVFPLAYYKKLVRKQLKQK